MLTAAIAHHLDELGIVDYRPNADGGDCFLDHQPSGPDDAVFLIPTGAFDQPTKNAFDIPTFQVVTRGPRFDPLPSITRQGVIFDALTCLDGTLIAAGTPHETWVIGVTPTGGARDNPTSLGRDGNERPEHSANYRAHVRSITAQRPGAPHA